MFPLVILILRYKHSSSLYRFWWLYFSLLYFLMTSWSFFFPSIQLIFTFTFLYSYLYLFFLIFSSLCLLFSSLLALFTFFLYSPFSFYFLFPFLLTFYSLFQFSETNTLNVKYLTLTESLAIDNIFMPCNNLRVIIFWKLCINIVIVYFLEKSEEYTM